jgi:uncharacterized membrane protein (UPF0127 family)
MIKAARLPLAWLVPFGFLAMAVAPVHAQPGKPNSGLPVITLSIGNVKISAEVASTPAQREIGLMYRFSLQPDHGMLFVFEQPQPLGFWMRNTYVPLSIAFIDATGNILNIEDMAPLDESAHRSRGRALYALEMRQGWFAQKGIAAGQRVVGIPPRAEKR